MLFIFSRLDQNQQCKLTTYFVLSNDCISLSLTPLSTGMDAETMSQLIEYSYTSNIKITKENAQNLLSAANLIQLGKILTWRRAIRFVRSVCSLASLSVIAALGKASLRFSRLLIHHHPFKLPPGGFQYYSSFSACLRLICTSWTRIQPQKIFLMAPFKKNPKLIVFSLILKVRNSRLVRRSF